MIQVKELRGYKSLRAFNVFHTLMLGLKMLPEYMTQSYEDFFSKIEAMPPEDQEKMIRKAAVFVELQKDEIETLVCFCEDPNGIAYNAASLKNLAPDVIYELIVAVCIEISKIKVNFVSDAEKKN